MILNLYCPPFLGPLKERDILKHFYAMEDNKTLIKQKIEAFQGENFYKLMLEKVLI